MDILITGASGVIGAAIARELAELPNTKLHLSARKRERLLTLQEELEKKGGTPLLYEADLADLDQAKRLSQRYLEQSEQPWALVCNAGNFGEAGALAECDWDRWIKSFHDNFFSHARIIQEFVRYFKVKNKRGGRVIVMSGAGVGDKSPGFATAYRVAKSALVGLVEAMAEELAEDGITINAVAPGAVKSGITEQIIHAAGTRQREISKDAEKTKETGGVSPEFAAKLIAYLLSPQAGHITGRLLSGRGNPPEQLKRLSPDELLPYLYQLRRIDDERFVKGKS